MTDDTTGPVVLWENYGCEGWKPKSYGTIKEALMDTRYNSEFVVTRIVDFDVKEVAA